MSLPYQLKNNMLTPTPTYSALAKPNVSINDDELARLFNIANPSMSVTSVLSYIAGFREIVQQQLILGNSITLLNFIRIFPSIRGKLETPDDSVGKDDLEINSVIAREMVSTVRNEISLTRLPYTEKVPSISFHSDAGGWYNLLGNLETLSGAMMQFDASDPLQGVFLKNKFTAVVDKPTEYAINTMGRNVFNTPVISTPTEGRENEFEISLSTRYTSNGTYRTGTYSRPVRTGKVVTTAELGQVAPTGPFYSSYDIPGQDGNDLSAATYSAPGDVYKFYIKCNPTVAGIITETDPMEFLVGVWDDSNNIIESDIVTVLPSPNAQQINISCVIPGNNGVGNITSIELWLDSLRNLGTLANQYYGGEIYDYFTLDDSANLPP